MEAMAHYNAVMELVMADDPQGQQRLFNVYNSPWLGRPQHTPSYNAANQRLLDIDHQHQAVLDHKDYLSLKDVVWFIKKGEPYHISSITFLQGKPIFTYKSMGEVVCGYLCKHINGNLMDNRKVNLCHLP